MDVELPAQHRPELQPQHTYRKSYIAGPVENRPPRRLPALLLHILM